MARILFVSKPVVPPWNDSNKNLVRDLAMGLTRHRAELLVTSEHPWTQATVTPRIWYRGHGSYAPSRWTNAQLLARLVLTPGPELWHFFFQPNPLTLRAGALARALRRMPTVHTIASAPDGLEALAPRLFADRVVALSEHTVRRLERVGLPAVHIPPALTMPELSQTAVMETLRQHGLEQPYVLYPGDLEFGNGAELFLRAAARVSLPVRWVVASRPKTPGAKTALQRLQQLAQELQVKVTWLGEIRDIHALLAGALAVVLVSDSLHAKMDWPLVLLEALGLGVPIVVSDKGPSAELAPSGAAAVVAPDSPEALGTALRSLHRQAPEERARRGEVAKAWVRNTCAPGVVARAHEALYDSVLAARGRAVQ